MFSFSQGASILRLMVENGEQSLMEDILEDNMLNFVLDFLQSEAKKEFIVLLEKTNGIEYIYTKYKKYNYLHSYYKPLTETQIDKLQQDVNLVQGASYTFPQWYRDFLKTTNGINLFFGSIAFYGEQTPLINHPKYGLIEALIERNNPDWMAPYNLRFTDSIRYDGDAQNRWLTIGSYHSDGTQIVWDFKKKKLVLMYRLPATISVKKLKKMKEMDYEKLVFDEYTNLQEFFTLETARLDRLFSQYQEIEEIDQCDVEFWKQTLPVTHKNHKCLN